MSWNEPGIIDYFFDNNQVFLDRYTQLLWPEDNRTLARPDAMTGPANNAALIAQRRAICRALAEAMPHGRHDSPGFAVTPRHQRPWLVISHFTGPALAHFSNTKITITHQNQAGNTYCLGFKWDEDEHCFMGQELDELISLHAPKGLVWENLARHQGNRFHRSIKIAIPDVQDGLGGNLPSITVGWLHALLQAIDENIFAPNHYQGGDVIVTPKSRRLYDAQANPYLTPADILG